MSIFRTNVAPRPMDQPSCAGRSCDLLQPTARSAAQHVAALCQELFRWQRWNCSSVGRRDLGPDLTRGTREQAYVYALSAAALAHGAARACAAGTLPLCGCGPTPAEPPDGNFRWGGCPDNVRFGLRLARSLPIPRGPDTALNRHNSRVGRRVRSEFLDCPLGEVNSRVGAK
ncbi:Wnt11 [Cordylochernes scorpioides]|uniref:Protein Wnt n=1 Tax=Cordylochernes scorpioides TaxID=51811 RepID=A0ABY6KSM7_9ARAC|nr:Wnt11 [Cordylochernes scorpioides]